MKKISELINSFGISKDKYEDFDVVNICDDSRKVTPGSIFFALSGSLDDGKKYINQAVSLGAKCVVLSEDREIDSEFYEYVRFSENRETLFIYVKDVRKVLAEAAANFYDSHDFYRKSRIVSVTGTNGKSSTVDIIRQIWAHDERNAASIGTLGVIGSAGHVYEASSGLTSPGAIKLHSILKTLAIDGVNNVAMEASSHGMAQKRLYAIPFEVCAYTNFSQDHLDYHKTLENYWLAKEALFSEFAQNDTVFVLNYDDEYSEKLLKIAKARGIKYLGYGSRSDSDARIFEVVHRHNGQLVSGSFLGKEFSILLPLFGTFQVYNALCSALTAYVSSVSIERIIEALQLLKPINGRLEMIAEFNGAKIYIDYAHTPDALKKAILSVKEHHPKRIFTLFGCGGERDSGKRILMGKVAQEYSDITIVTDDNSRNEDAAQIRRMIMEGGEDAIEIPDRKTAIETAMERLSEGDALVIAGKGHENYQITNLGVVKFSDKQIVLDKVLK